MDFGEKLTNLRKQKGLSQEELGEQLNVTRQTISKWELGQTSPDTGKLTEISKFFGIGVNELTSEENIEVNNAIKDFGQEKEKKFYQDNRNLLACLFILCAITAIVLIVIGINKNNIKKSEEEKMNQIITQGQDNIDLIMDYGQDMLNSMQEQYDAQKSKEEDKKTDEAEKEAEQFLESQKSKSNTSDAQKQIEEAQERQQQIIQETQERQTQATQEQQQMIQEAQQKQQQLMQEAQQRQQQLLEQMQ